MAGGARQASVRAVSGQEEGWRGWQQPQVKTRVTALPPDGWGRRSAGAGTQGLRWYAWDWLPLARPLLPDWDRWRVVRRPLRAPPALTAYVVLAPRAMTLATVGHVAGSRWTSAQGVAEAKGEVGLEPYAVRRWPGWSRHSTLARGASARLPVLRAANLPEGARAKKWHGAPRGAG